MPARRPPKPARLVEIGVKDPLTTAELRRLRDLAAAELRSVAGLASWLVAQSLERSHDPRRAVRGASARDQRQSIGITVRLTGPQQDELQARVRAELRSVSGYVGRVIVEALAKKH